MTQQHHQLYAATDVRKYADLYWPAEQLWTFFAVPMVANYKEQMLRQGQTAERKLCQELRNWRFGTLDGDYPCSDARQFRQYFRESLTGRYDAGAIHEGPIQSLKQSPALNKQFTVDFDATDYKVFRAKCGCGTSDHTKMCERCIEVIRTAARVAVDILERAYGFKRVHCFFSGGRGLHIRVLDYEACCLDDAGRTEIANMIRNATQNEALQPICASLKKLSERPDVAMKLDVMIDYRVSTETGRLTRGPFSVHDGTGRICLPLESPEAFTSVEVSPKLTDLLQALAGGTPPDTWTRALKLLEKWTTID